jgi:2-polyprenyl-6-methoxyphenol hydroxylase-like FAD-dependent oxidoreductase
MIDVLIVGAGPTGLVLALWLKKMGVNIRIIDKTETSGTTSRALAVHARTLELYEQLALSDAVIAAGQRVPRVNLWVKGEKKAQVDFQDAGESITPFPFLHIFQQDEHEKLLISRLKDFGVEVDRKTELISFTDAGSSVQAKLQGPNGEETVEARFIAGCDGAHSKVRAGLGITFPGGTYQQLFYVADISASGPALNGELHIDLDEADFLAVFPLKGEGRARLIGTVRDERAQNADTLKFEDVSDRAIQHMKVHVNAVNWFSTYRVHHRVAPKFRGGNAFLLGDAAHIHSPAGGQGMNTGIGDAINLAWKLKWFLDGRAEDNLLASYEEERIAFARKLVATTDRGFTLASADGPIADFIRTRVLPVVLPAAAHFSAFREWAFRTVSQTLINYRDDSFSVGKAGTIAGGDRLPWLPEAGNYEPLAEIAWQVHIYGTPTDAMAAWCAANHVQLHAFDWRDDFGAKGFTENAAFLIRPDTYVAAADPLGDSATFADYFRGRRLTP